MACVCGQLAHNIGVLRVNKSISTAILAGSLAGCQTPPDLPPQITPLDRAPETSATAEPAEPAVQSPLLDIPTDQLIDTWIPWENWVLANGGGSSLPAMSGGPRQRYELQATNGVLAIVIGSRLAYWNGIQCWLGFAPQLFQNKPFIHALDAKKNLLPLMSPAPELAKTNCIIVIDPGHGGKNTGAKCVVNGQYEKDYTLDWALCLQKLLSTNGWTVQLTRTNDADLSLPERVQLADRWNADLFISLHFNSAGPYQERSGLETYCLTPVGMASNLTREYEDDTKAVFPNNSFDDLNVRYAMRLQKAMVFATGRPDGGVRRARFMAVLRDQNRPAILLEGGYLSNPQEARLIMEAGYRQKLAEAIAAALAGQQPGLDSELDRGRQMSQ